jgi:Sap, sulfolipid-1-addressing protein
VTFEVIVLALGSAPRPAGVAALYALLSAPHPRRVLVAYVIAGFVFSAAIGIAVVAFFHGAGLRHQNSVVNSLIQLLAGVAALGYAAGVGTGRAQPPSRSGSPEESRVTQYLRNPSVGTAAVAGAATHLPGLFYLVALNSIASQSDSFAVGVLEVLLFNAIWFGAAILSVLLFLIRPGAARRALGRMSAWAERNARATTIGIFALVGAYLTVSGVLGLAD